MSKVLAVAWREFKATALTRAFILAAIVVPLLAVGMGVLGPALFSERPAPLSGTLAIIDPTGDVAEAARHEFASEDLAKRLGRLETPQIDMTGAGPDGQAEDGGISESRSETPSDISIAIEHVGRLPDEAALESLKGRVRDGTLLGLAEVTPRPAATESAPPADPANVSPARADVGTFEVKLYLPTDTNFKHTILLEETMSRAAGRARIQQAGLNVEQIRDLARGPRVQTVSLGREAGEDAPTGELAKVLKLLVPMAFMLLLWISTFVSANYLLTSTIEEKSNKVVEVLLSAVSPMQLMAGKIVGQALVGAVLLVMYAGLGATIVAVLAVAGGIVGPFKLLLLGLYFIMAYFMIAAIMAGIGSAVNEMREAQSLMGPAMIVLMVPLFLWLPISDSPNGTLATITSFIPPLTPFVMILRVNGSEPVALWQILATLIVGYAAAVAMVWMAAKIFRVGVLMYGKPPTPIELIRWIRYS